VFRDHTVPNPCASSDPEREGPLGQIAISILVTLEPGRSLFDLIAIKLDLEDLLHLAVDVVTEAGVSPYLRDRVFAEARPLTS
jgi:hypothetical protein